MKDRKLRKLLNIKKNEWGDSLSSEVLSDLINKVDRMYRVLFVENYFVECPCCGGGKEILKSESKSFEQIEKGWDFIQQVVVRYTTEQGYNNHLPAIQEMEKEVAKYEKSKN
jgi:hypothetical protein